MSLSAFLDEKPLYYNEIDYTRMPRVYEKIKSNFSDAKIIHLIGTNGKGTTGRFLATALSRKGFKIGHYTSPHIMNFNERIWLNGKNVEDARLQVAHEKLQDLLSEEDAFSLSYFEYTTFLAMLVFDGCTYIVLEAGLGGEHDATAVFEKTLTLVTPIDYDHQAFLGSNITSIASTKLRAVQNNAIMATQHHKEVYSISQELEVSQNVRIHAVETFLDEKDKLKGSSIGEALSLAPYLIENLQLSIAGLKFLGLDYKLEDFEKSLLFGRLTHISDNIIVDVGHNTLAASSIVKALEGKKFILVYNTYKDKEYKKILEILKPIIIHVEIIEILEQRIEIKEKIYQALTDLEIKYTSFKKANTDDKYLVFGSFSVIENFLREHSE